MLAKTRETPRPIMGRSWGWGWISQRERTACKALEPGASLESVEKNGCMTEGSPQREAGEAGRAHVAWHHLPHR